MNKRELREQIIYSATLVIKDRMTQDMVEMVSKSEVLDLIDQLDEPKKVVIPQSVAEKIKYCKANSGYSLFHAMDYSINKIAKIFKCDRSTIKSRIHEHPHLVEG